MSEPTPERLREDAGFLAREMMPGPERARVRADLLLLADDLEGSTQPTRDDLLRLISSDECIDNESDLSPSLIADALIRRGWLGVSDTPNEGAG